MLADVRFSIPALDRTHVSRRRLINGLAAPEQTPLVLVSGPAGSGKTALVTEWVRSAADPRTGWVTFEDGDSGFWPDVFDCLRRRGLPVPTVRPGASDTLLVGRKNVLALAASLVAGGDRWTIVLDGYELDSLTLAREIDLLMEHAGGHLRIVWIARVDPVLPLYRYRLAGQLAEVRSADLAFTDVEVARLLARRGVTLPADSVRRLNGLLEGWAAGIVFAARALSSVTAPGEVQESIVEHSGDITEYLVGEVLDRQTPEMRQFLLVTAVPDVVTPGLVQELLGAEALPLLEAAARANVFLEPVPDQPDTFRFHPLFRELLRARLAYEAPAPMEELHRRAAHWYRARGAVEHAIEHLVRAGAWGDLSEQLVEDGLVGRLLLEGGSGPIHAAAGRIPADVATPEAGLVRAAVALSAGDLEVCEAELSRADATADITALAVRVVDAVRGSIADDVGSAVASTELAERSLQSAHPSTRSAELASVLHFARGVALLRSGRLREACEALERAARTDETEPYPQFRARCYGQRAIAEALQGETAEAERTAARALMAAVEGGPARADSVEPAHVALGLAAVEQHDMEAARQHLEEALRLAARAGRIAETTTETSPPDDMYLSPGPRPVVLEALTPKELEVLRALEQLFTTEEIAGQMFVSVNTVRTHVRNILRKLGVNRRNAAIRRARAVGLLSG